MILNFSRHRPSHDRAVETVLLIHGLGSAGTIFKKLAELLSREFDVIVIDLPGHGATPLQPGVGMSPLDMALHIRHTMDELGIEKAHLVGNSLGGWIAFELAALHPERVSSAVGLAPAGMRETPLNARDLLLSFNRILAKALKPWINSLVRLKFMRRIGFSRNSPLWEQWSLETCRDAAIAMSHSTGYPLALRASLGKVAENTLKVPDSVPLIVVFGDTDNIIPAKSGQSKIFMPPHAQWLIWENCGHAIQLDHPERVVELLVSLRA